MSTFREIMQDTRNKFPLSPSERLSKLLAGVRVLTNYVDDLQAFADTAGVDEEDVGQDYRTELRADSETPAQLVSDRMLVGLARDVPGALTSAVELCEFFEKQLAGLNARLSRQVAAMRALKGEKRVLEVQLEQAGKPYEKQIAGLQDQLKASHTVKEEWESKADSFRQERDASRSKHDKLFGELTDLKRRLTEYDPAWESKLAGRPVLADDDLDWVDSIRSGGLGE